jgi:hypothetical protein
MSLRRVIDYMLATLSSPNLLSNLLRVSDICDSNLADAVPISTLAAPIALPGLSLSRSRPSIICGLIRLYSSLLSVRIVRLLIHSIHHQHEKSVVRIIIVVAQS